MSNTCLQAENRAMSIDTDHRGGMIDFRSVGTPVYGRWGQDDVSGTANFPDDTESAGIACIVERGRSFRRPIQFTIDGPENAWRPCNTPVRPMPPKARTGDDVYDILRTAATSNLTPVGVPVDLTVRK